MQDSVNRDAVGELLEADQEREWQARDSIYMICGNAGGAEVTVNGEEKGIYALIETPDNDEFLEKLKAKRAEIGLPEEVDSAPLPEIP